MLRYLLMITLMSGCTEANPLFLVVSDDGGADALPSQMDSGRSTPTPDEGSIDLDPPASDMAAADMKDSSVVDQADMTKLDMTSSPDMAKPPIDMASPPDMTKTCPGGCIPPNGCTASTCVDGKCVISNLVLGSGCWASMDTTHHGFCNGKGVCGETCLKPDGTFADAFEATTCGYYESLVDNKYYCVNCDDNNSCTTDSCNSTNGTCVYTHHPFLSSCTKNDGSPGLCHFTYVGSDEIYYCAGNGGT